MKPQPKGKPSGLPFKSRFTDVAAAAGLTAPVIYGGVDRKASARSKIDPVAFGKTDPD